MRISVIYRPSLCITQIPGEYRINCISLLILIIFFVCFFFSKGFAERKVKKRVKLNLVHNRCPLYLKQVMYKIKVELVTTTRFELKTTLRKGKSYQSCTLPCI